MELPSNVEVLEYGAIRRKSKKYSLNMVNRHEKLFEKGESECN